MKTKTEVLTEFENHFVLHPERRAKNHTTQSCFYKDKSTGNCCAVGLFLNDPEEIEDICGGHGFGYVLENYEYSWEIFKPAYRIEDRQFWEELQGVHDAGRYWNMLGLSDEGRNELERLKAKYQGA